MTPSEELIERYSKQQPVTKKAPESTNNDNRVYYAQNSFKRFMGYKEPDYLQVAGLYASTESSSKSKIYGGFLVKKADYVAKMLKWYTDDGQIDSKRAERAIRSACRTKAPNGLFYMYTMTNKRKILSEKGGSSIYMSGRRYKEILDELTKRATNQPLLDEKGASIDNEESEQANDFDKVKAWVERLAYGYGFCGYEDGAVVWVTNQLLQKLTVEQIRSYFNQVISSEYCKQARYNIGCPQLNGIFDIYHKYDKIQAFMSDWRRHI